MIARDEINTGKIVIHVLQCPKAIIQRDNVQTGSIVVPVAQEHAGLATFLSGFGSGPLHKVQAVLIVSDTVAL